MDPGTKTHKVEQDEKRTGANTPGHFSVNKNEGHKNTKPTGK